jgi:hypothetical protein
MQTRAILATATVIQFLASQPGEFTSAEIRRLARRGFDCDTDEEDVEAVCDTLADDERIRRTFQPPYVAYSAAR